FYEPLDLKIASCRLMLAGRGTVEDDSRRLRIATKYAATTRRYFAEKGVQVEVVKLYGSMELAPLVGLADYIVDLVDTGTTLKANDLVAMEEICDVSSRLIVNKASMKIKHSMITDLISRLASVVG
ncbi:MAG: ATP phosphoribosyltransferase, partial [Gammaproteobacteria bacterium]|nr:ATP phosphoribosyltransferase [Gammaproteobacteria bacterium]